jgi:hypothetical protein
LEETATMASEIWDFGSYRKRSVVTKRWSQQHRRPLYVPPLARQRNHSSNICQIWGKKQKHTYSGRELLKQRPKFAPYLISFGLLRPDET